MKYDLINYFDVWGNEEDGFEVNDQSIFMRNVVVSDSANDTELVELVKSLGFFNDTACTRSIEVIDWGHMIEFQERKTSMPLCAFVPSRGQ